MMIAQFQEQDRKSQQVVEEKCSPPSPRFVKSLALKSIIYLQGVEITFLDDHCAMAHYTDLQRRILCTHSHTCK